MRLDKYLAHAGIGTRKEVKQMIRKKRISVNGITVCKDDIHIDEEHDCISLDGKNIRYQSKLYIMLNKPAGVISATKDDMQKTVLDCIDDDLPADCFPVGRLDIDTEGLLLITNDGKLSHFLLSPRHHVEKEYFVEFSHPLNETDKIRLTNGSIFLDEEPVKKAKLTECSETSCHLTISEGKFHQIKRMFHAVNNEVIYLKRIRMGSLSLDEDLNVGEYRNLSKEEIQRLREYI